MDALTVRPRRSPGYTVSAKEQAETDAVSDGLELELCG
jgi:hypothetical protein